MDVGFHPSTLRRGFSANKTADAPPAQTPVARS